MQRATAGSFTGGKGQSEIPRPCHHLSRTLSPTFSSVAGPQVTDMGRVLHDAFVVVIIAEQADVLAVLHVIACYQHWKPSAKHSDCQRHDARADSSAISDSAFRMSE